MQKWSLARRFFVGQLVFLAMLTAAVSAALFIDARSQEHERAGARMLSVARTLADSPGVAEAVQGPDPSAVLQPYALEVIHDAGVDFVTIMAPDRTRYTHPDPTRIGEPYIGSIDAALAGGTMIEEYAGTLGPSVRAIVPVFDDDGTVVALAAAGVTVTNLSVALQARIPAVAGLALAVIAASALAAGLLSRYLRRVTFDRGPEELARVFVFYDSVLHSVRDGLLLVDPKGALVLYNDQAARLLALPDSRPAEPQPVAVLDLPDSVKTLLGSGRRAVDELHVTSDRILVVNQEPAVPHWQSVAGGRRAETPQPRSYGTVTTLRDHTEIEALTGEVESMRTLTEALRAQTHEHANRLHTIVSLIELGRGTEALDFATRDLQHSQRLTDEVVAAVDEPFLTALLVGKAAQANERGIRLDIRAGKPQAFGGGPGVGFPTGRIPATELVTIVGNLLDNAFDAAAGSADKRVGIELTTSAAGLRIAVTDSGPGLAPEDAEAALRLGFSTKDGQGHGIGLALVRQAVNRLRGGLRIEKADEGGAAFIVTLPLPEGDRR